MAGRWELADEQWELVEPVLRPARREDNRGRPWHDTRGVLHGVFWILGSGAQWSEIPAKHPPYQTCHRRFQQWVREGKLVKVLRLLARQLHERGTLNLDEAFVDATFASAQKGLRCRFGQARQRREDRRYRLWRWPSSRRICRSTLNRARFEIIAAMYSIFIR